jgi:hypothetical protein
MTIKQEIAYTFLSIILIIVLLGVFSLFYGKKVEPKIESSERLRLATENAIIQDSLNRSQQLINALKHKNALLIDTITEIKIEYGNINKKYDKVSDAVRIMPIDEQVRFLASWLPKDNSLQK